MRTIIKEIGKYLNISRTELAEQLGVAPATVKRWENGHVLPSKAAQLKLYDFCREKAVPVYDMTLDKIEALSAGLFVEKERKLLYHGSKAGIVGNIAPKSRRQCDFGRGFYMGTELGQVLTLICDYEKSRFYIVSVDVEGLACLDIPSNIDWAMFVAYNRGRMEKVKGTEFYRQYSGMAGNVDLISGSIANDRMFYVIDNFFLGNITDTALINSLSALRLGKQYVAVTQKACDAVRIELEVPLSYVERLFIKDFAENNRAKGVSLANDICKNYRRSGKFFDEILDEARK
ncbi:MAG: DUF3990 domain-containing protein [Clostridium sp.]|nr:DUF3990 domain-containing protein [Clostridium sp.]